MLIFGVAVIVAVGVAGKYRLSVVGPLEAVGGSCGLFVELPAVRELVEYWGTFTAAIVEEINAVSAYFKGFAVVVYHFHCVGVFDWLIFGVICCPYQEPAGSEGEDVPVGTQGDGDGGNNTKGRKDIIK